MSIETLQTPPITDGKNKRIPNLIAILVQFYWRKYLLFLFVYIFTSIDMVIELQMWLIDWFNLHVTEVNVHIIFYSTEQKTHTFCCIKELSL